MSFFPEHNEPSCRQGEAPQSVRQREEVGADLRPGSSPVHLLRGGHRDNDAPQRRLLSAEHVCFKTCLKDVLNANFKTLEGHILCDSFAQ